jgi:hypothetical protein
MKKQLLLTAALIAALGTFSQNSTVKSYPIGKTDLAEKFMKRQINLKRTEKISIKNSQMQAPDVELFAKNEMSSAALSWNIIGGSMNIYGVLQSENRPLQYNDELNAVTFLHRKSTTYTTGLNINANAESGIMVAEISTNWGTTWDSTCIWANNNDWGRYPGGGIYNPVGNTNIANAYFVGSGPCTGIATSPSWINNWFASKQLGVANYNNSPSSTNLAMQSIPNTPTSMPSPMGKHFFSNAGFTATDDGVAHSVWRYTENDQGTTFDAIGPLGATVVKGTFNSGAFTWTSDYVICAAALKASGKQSMNIPPLMAWNEAGTVGYVVFIGSAASASAALNSSNKGWQPIVYKTTNSGSSWSLINGIDFNNPSFKPILRRLPAIWESKDSSVLKVPFFNLSEGIGLTVDMNNKLHIVSTLVGTASNHIDSITSTYQFDAIEKYSWSHTPGDRPYLYDFIGDGTGNWTYKLIDSLSTEGCGTETTDPGYNENPWDIDGTTKVVSTDARIQAGRSADGKYIIYSWVESDTNFTNNGKKWNSQPDMHIRCMDVANGYSVHPNELNVTAGAGGVGTRAMCHYMSNTGSNAVMNNFTTTISSSTVLGSPITTFSTNSLEFKMPMTVSNSQPYSQLTNNTHWYLSDAIKFQVKTVIKVTYVGINENALNSTNNSFLYPNPTQNASTLAIDMKENSTVNISVMTISGQIIKTTKTEAQIGENNISVDLTGLASGLYLVKVKTGNATSTKKLIVE